MSLGLVHVPTIDPGARRMGLLGPSCALTVGWYSVRSCWLWQGEQWITKENEAVVRSTANVVQVRTTQLQGLPLTPSAMCWHHLGVLWCITYAAVCNTLAVTWKRNYYCSGEANYKCPLFWLTIFEYLFVPKRLKKILIFLNKGKNYFLKLTMQPK